MRRLSVLVLVVALSSAFGCRSDDNNGNGHDTSTNPDPDGGGGGEGGPGPGGATIFDITSGTIKEGESVTLNEVIVTSVDGYGDFSGDLYVQDPKGGPGSGLKLFGPERGDGGKIVDLKLGDRVKVEGAVKYFTPKTPFDDEKHPNKVHIKELERPQVTHLSSGTDPEPAVVTVAELTEDPTAEGWEGVLVQVKDVAVTEGVNKYGEIRVTGNLAVDDELYPPDDVAKLGDCMTITGISFYFYGFKLNPRSAADLQAGSNCPEPTQLTIKDIQDESSPKHPADGDQVTVTGVVTAVDGTTGGSADKFNVFWIQDGSGPFSGIAIHYEWDRTTADKPVLGETVEVSGTYNEYFDESQLDNVTFSSKGAATPPDPEVIANSADIATGGAKAEQFEGVLVEVQDVEVKGEVKTTGDNPRVVGLELTSGLYVESDLYEGFIDPVPAAGTKYKVVRGVLRFSYKNFKIVPRNAEDLTPE